MFRGFFPNDDLFAKFRLSFRQIMVKYLPSRKEGNQHLELDPRLMDLFLSLKGDKPELDSDIGDQVEDLISFVLDNFKFHGEQIAIDEVDLDAVSLSVKYLMKMTIDIQEAIRCYHEAATPRKQEHVILILDKSLHLFPWESMPCLRGRSVSRLPSLGSLIERTVDSPVEGPTWPTVAANRGFYILNPSGDLTHTQSQFENTLSKYLS
jgi:separase